jgi:hypothetical protein
MQKLQAAALQETDSDCKPAPSPGAKKPEPRHLNPPPLALTQLLKVCLLPRKAETHLHHIQARLQATQQAQLQPKVHHRVPICLAASNVPHKAPGRNCQSHQQPQQAGAHGNLSSRVAECGCCRRVRGKQAW